MSAPGASIPRGIRGTGWELVPARERAKTEGFTCLLIRSTCFGTDLLDIGPWALYKWPGPGPGRGGSGFLLGGIPGVGRCIRGCKWRDPGAIGGEGRWRGSLGAWAREGPGRGSRMGCGAGCVLVSGWGWGLCFRGRKAAGIACWWRVWLMACRRDDAVTEIHTVYVRSDWEERFRRGSYTRCRTRC